MLVLLACSKQIPIEKGLISSPSLCSTFKFDWLVCVSPRTLQQVLHTSAVINSPSPCPQLAIWPNRARLAPGMQCPRLNDVWWVARLWREHLPNTALSQCWQPIWGSNHNIERHQLWHWQLVPSSCTVSVYLEEDQPLWLWTTGEASPSFQAREKFSVASWALAAPQRTTDPPSTQEVCRQVHPGWYATTQGKAHQAMQRLPICLSAYPDFLMLDQMPMGQRWHPGLSAVWGHCLNGPFPSAALLHRHQEAGKYQRNLCAGWQEVAVVWLRPGDEKRASPWTA